MPFGMCNASATFQRAIARALRKIANREGSMVMAVEDHMVRLREVFQCLREAGFKMRVYKCHFLKSEIKNLGRVVSAEGIKRILKQCLNCAIEKYPETRQSCKLFWAWPLFIASLFLGMPNLWPPCMLLQA